jgi:type II secretory pathway component PulF
MRYLALLIVLILALLFVLPSVSQSYASGRQAQAVIETSRATQIANFGNLLVIAILAVMLLAALGVIVYLLWRMTGTLTQRDARCVRVDTRPSAGARHIAIA